jgi:hypothetical protein
MISKPPLHLVALLVASLGLGLVVPTARAADEDEAAADEEAVEEASERFRRGVKLYKDRDFVAALVEFKRAYELAPNYRVLYNLGQTSRELKDYASALVAYQQYLEQGGDEIRAKRRKEVESVIEDLTDRVGKLAISTNVEGAEVQIDDEVVGVSPLDDPVVVNIGKRRVVATLGGYAPARRVVEVAGRDELVVKLELADLSRDDGGETPTPRPAEPTPDEAEGGLPVAGIVALSITGACGIVTGVLGGLALSAKGERDDALAAFPGNAQAIEDAKSKTSTLALATDVMIGVTAAGAVTSLVLFLVNPGSGSGSDEDAGDTAQARVSVLPSVDGVWVTGTF